MLLKESEAIHLICDASNEKSGCRLREIKQRDTKPFAVMFRDLEHLQVYTVTEPMEERCLVSLAPSDRTAEATEPVSFRNQSGHAYARMYVCLICRFITIGLLVQGYLRW